MIINTQKYNFNNIKQSNPIIIQNNSSSSFDNKENKNTNHTLYNKENKKQSTKDKLEELNQIFYTPSSINTMILKTKFETLA